MLNNKECYLNNKAKLEVINNNVYINGIKLNLLGKGVDGIVYKYHDKAIKLYHDSFYIKEHLSIKQIETLSLIPTKKIILPKEALKNNDNNFGYIMKYIDLNHQKNILLEEIYTLTKKIKQIEEELMLIGKNNFLLDDFKTENLIYNGDLFLIDPDSFVFEQGIDFSLKNQELFVWYFIKNIIFSLNSNVSKKEIISSLRKMHYLYKKSEIYYFSDFLKENFGNCSLYEIRELFITNKIKILNKF